MNDLERSLNAWINSNHLQKQSRSIEELADGVLLFELMAQVNPTYFDLSSIWTVPNDNWAYKLENLRKLWKSLERFYNEVLEVEFESVMEPVDFSEVARSNQKQGIIFLSELVLGAIVQCPEKQRFIQRILDLPETTQSELMILIQKIVEKCDKRENCEYEFSEAKKEVQKLRQEKRQLLHQIEVYQQHLINEAKQYENAVSERDQLRLRNQDLEAQLNFTSKTPKASLEASAITRELENQLQKKDSIIQDLKHQLEISSKKHEQEAYLLKDEIDVLSERLLTVSKAESTLEIYKKRLEEMTVLRGRLKEFERENKDLREQFRRFEEDASGASNLKQTLQYYKEQLAQEKEKNAEFAVYNEQKDRQIKELTRHRKEMEERRKFLEKENRELQEELDRANYGPDSARYEEDVLGKGLQADLEEQIKRLQAENLALQKRRSEGALVKELNEQIDATLVEKKIVENKLKADSNDKAQLAERCSVLMRELEEVRAGLESKQQDFENELQALQCENDELNKRLEKVTKEKAQFEHLQIENEQLRQDKNESIQELRKFLKEKDALTNKIMELKDEVHSIGTQLTGKELQCNSLSTVKAQLETQISMWQEKEKSYIVEISLLKSKVQGAEHGDREKFRILELERDNMKLENQISNLNLTIKDKDHAIYKLTNDRSHMESELQELMQAQHNSLNSAYDTEIKKLRSELEEKESDAEFLKKSRDEIHESMKKESRMMSVVIHEIGLDIMRHKFAAREESLLRSIKNRRY